MKALLSWARMRRWAATVGVAAACAIIQSCGGCGNCVVPVFVSHPFPPIVNLRVALISDDGSGSTHGITMFKLEDDSGNALPAPTATLLPIVAAGDLDGQDLTPDGKRGVSIDGGNNVYFFSGADTGHLSLSPNTLSVQPFGGDGDSIATLPEGDEVVVSADSPTQLIVISGIVGGNPVLADSIAIPGKRDTTLIPADGRTLLARGLGGLTVYSIKASKPHTGSLGGTVRHTYAQVADIASAGHLAAQNDGRGGMAFSPTDSSRAILLGTPTDTNAVSLVTGLPVAPVVHPAALDPAGSTFLYCVSMSKDGSTAFIGSDKGIVVVSGVKTGNLAQVGPIFSPTFVVGGTTYSLLNVRTLGVTLDGKYIAAFPLVPSQASGTLLLLRIGAGGALQVVGQANGVPIPHNDQVLMH